MNFSLRPAPDNHPLPKAIIFDWDNTLVDSWGVIHHALMATFEQMGLEAWSLDETKSRVRHSLRESFPLLFGDQWELARDFYYHHFEKSHLVELKALQRAEELLKLCQDCQIPALIISNKTGRYLRKEIAALGWEPYFLSVIGAGDADRDKPDPIVVEQSLAVLPVVASSEIWFVGDTDVDLICAGNSGCLPVFVGDPGAVTPTGGEKLVDGMFFNSIGCVCDALSRWK